jgi:(S)-3,5-dihydroxyphenylglycine transaminase
MNPATSSDGMSARAEVMNFLNEVSGRYPQAVSFASGRPAQQFFRFDEMLAGVGLFVDRFGRERGLANEDAWALLAQYGPTNGILNDLVSRQVDIDHGVVAPPGQIVVTGGCQEALSLLVQILCPEPNDVVLVRSPCYVGMTGAADLNQIELLPVGAPDDPNLAQSLCLAVEAAAGRGKRPRVLYLVPDFDNPTGTVLTRAEREEIIDLCARHQIIVIEDNPYGMFHYDGEQVPSMYSLDTHGCVIFLGTYSKTLCPTVRVGFAAIPEQLFDGKGDGRDLVARLSQAKSFVTVNTSQLTQAVVGSVLLAEDCTLERRVAQARDLYRSNRDHMLACLDKEFTQFGSQISWNRPEGGFFLTMRLPFAFGQREAEVCAGDYGVLVLPLSFFALDRSQDCSIRLAFSNVSHGQIETGIDRLYSFVCDRLER